MKTISLFVPGEFRDAYIYAGHLFAIKANADVVAIALEDLLDSADEAGALRTLLNIALLRNDWLENDQAIALLHIGAFSRAIRRQWETPTSIKAVGEKWKLLARLPHLNIQDFRVYGMKLFAGGRHGVFELGLDARERKRQLSPLKSLNKITDLPATWLATKGGALTISAGLSGLYSGWIGFPSERTSFNEKQIAARSFRTGWSNYNLINYPSQTTFSYLENETAERKKREFSYSRIDESAAKLRIVQFAKRTVDGKFMLETAGAGNDEFRYTFNAGSRIYTILESGRIVHRGIKTGRNALPHLEKRAKEMGYLPRPTRIVERPMSVNFGNRRMIIEMFGEIRVLEDHKLSTLQTSPAISVRTFSASRRFRNLALITREDGIVIHSFLPAILRRPSH